MTVKKWTLLDHSRNLFIDELVIGADDVGGTATGYSVVSRKLRAGPSEGVTVVRVDNGKFAFDILPTRGMGIWKAWLGDEEIGWQSPVRGPVHPQFVSVGEAGGLGWLDGFDELLVRCGLESNGAPEFDTEGRLRYPLHGRIANKPAYKVEVAIDGDSGEIVVTGEVEEARLHFLKLRMKTTLATRIGESGFRLRDEVVNFSESPAEFQLLYHINFGRPLLDAGSRLVAPVTSVVPRNAHAAEGIPSWDSYAAEQPGFKEQVYFTKLRSTANHDTQVLLRNAHGTRGVSLLWNTQQLPFFTVWKNTTAAADGYVTGLEPGTNLPNPRSFEGKHDRVARLPAGGSAVFDLQCTVHSTAPEVENAERSIALLAEGANPKIHDRPLADWCAP